MNTFRLIYVRQCHWLFWLVALVLTGCSSSFYRPSGSKSTEASSVSTGGTKPAKPVDLQPLAKRSAASIIKRSATQDIGKKPTLYVDMIRNSSGTQQDMAKLTGALHKALARSGRFKLIPLEKNAAYQQSLDYQQSEEAMNPSTAVQLGKQTGAELILYGSLGWVKKSKTYQLTTHMMDLKSGELLFTDKQSLRK